MSFVLKQLNKNRLKVEKSLPQVECSFVGGKINNRTLHKMIQNGYEDNPKGKDTIDGYQLDKSLSGTRAQVYYNPDTKHLNVDFTR